LAGNKEEQWLDTSLDVKAIKSFFQPFEPTAMDAYPVTRDSFQQKKLLSSSNTKECGLVHFPVRQERK